MTHLEKPFQDFQHRTNQQNLQEELRTWAKVDLLAARQLRAEGQPLDSDWIQADDILRKCRDNPQCPAFVKYVSGDRTPQTK